MSKNGKVIEDCLADIDFILSKRFDNGADFWATQDKQLNIGGPFSTLESAVLLTELGMPPTEPVLQSVAALIFDCLRDDGRFKLSPSGAIYPCHTIHALNVLCHLGYAEDSRLEKTFQYLLDTQFHDGGWRCNKFSFGRGPETEYSNPGPTLAALDAFRMSNYLNCESKLDQAVEFLLNHWIIRMPIGPCHYGIGTLFMQVEYPFLTYNLFNYVYVLSFYNRAKTDERFLEALSMLDSKTNADKIVVERVNRKLSGLKFCEKNKDSALGTKRYLEIRNNIILKL
jgi:hypothetical protein